MKALFLLPALLLGACSASVPVSGEMGKNKEKFIGEATGYMDRTGILTIVLNDGARCGGKWHFESKILGTGDFTCDDGRSGKFNFNSDGRNGQGFGKTNKGEPFVFVFNSNEPTDAESIQSIASSMQGTATAINTGRIANRMASPAAASAASPAARATPAQVNCTTTELPGTGTTKTTCY